MIKIIKHDNRPAIDKQYKFKCERCGREWHKYPDDIPPFDGDYLCYHKGFCNVYEYFRGMWYSESGESVKQIDKDGLYWQDLPVYPKQ